MWVGTLCLQNLKPEENPHITVIDPLKEPVNPIGRVLLRLAAWVEAKGGVRCFLYLVAIWDNCEFSPYCFKLSLY